MEGFTYFIIFLLGLAIGSFLNVVIYRLPRGKSLIFPPSSCPHCGNPIKPYHNIPILGWLILKGKCASCGKPISIRYPIVELLTGIGFIGIYYHLGEIGWQLGVMLALFSTLIALAGIDIDFKEVPDSLNLLGLTLAFFSSPLVLENFTNALLLIGGAGLIRYYSALLFRREALGEGDLIMAGTMGGILGIKLAIVAFVVANFLAMPIALYFRLKKSEESVPFIPFMVAATFLVWFFQPQFEMGWRWLYG